MTAQEFIQKWKTSTNYLGLPSVGIHVGWDLIDLDSEVKTLFGHEAWNLLYACIPPWFKRPQTFRELVTTQNSDYQQIVREETNNGKIDYYRRNGLREPVFCAFAKREGSSMLLGDGNHRFFDCIYLIDTEKRNFNYDIEKTTVDVIYLSNFEDVLRTNIIWNQQL
jgi:hypothetical protein